MSTVGASVLPWWTKTLVVVPLGAADNAVVNVFNVKPAVVFPGLYPVGLTMPSATTILLDPLAKFTVKVASDWAEEVDVPGATPITIGTPAGIFVNVWDAKRNCKLSINNAVPA